MQKFLCILYICVWVLRASTRYISVLHVARAFPIRKESAGGLPRNLQHSLARLERAPQHGAARLPGPCPCACATPTPKPGILQHLVLSGKQKRTIGWGFLQVYHGPKTNCVHVSLGFNGKKEVIAWATSLMKERYKPSTRIRGPEHVPWTSTVIGSDM